MNEKEKYMNLDEIYWASIFRLGKFRPNATERALVFLLGKKERGDYIFCLDETIIPETFPDYPLYEWHDISPPLILNLLKNHNYSGYSYPPKDIPKLKEKFNIE